MLDRYEFWHTAASLLMLPLLFSAERMRRAADPWGGYWLAAGILLPLLDYLAPLATASDAIGVLTRVPVLHSLSMGALVLAGLSLVAGMVAGPSRALRLTAWAAGGFLLHLGLDGLTEAGFWPGPAFQSPKWSLPAFARGHVLLVAVLASSLVLARTVPFRRNLVIRTGAFLAGLYLVGGLSQYAVAFTQAARAADAEQRDLIPFGHFRAGWLLVSESGETLQVSDIGPWGAARQTSGSMTRWNDEERFLEMISDPVVRRFYYEVFRHPVVRVEARASDAILVLREAADLHSGERGKLFTLSWAADGRERTYQVEGFR